MEVIRGFAFYFITIGNSLGLLMGYGFTFIYSERFFRHYEKL